MGTKSDIPTNSATPTAKSSSKLKSGSSAADSGSLGGCVNYLFYLVCITSLGITIYTNIRQSYLEDRLISLVSIEERLSLVEAQIKQFFVYNNPNPNNNNELINESNISHIVKKLSLQISELPRIRRDVSSLKLSRKDRRQASVQQIGGECVCPPGNLVNNLLASCTI